ncbi:hypothetical protein CEXT_337891 [Caerostris extrusa]|uniref:Uncharacterized protein n=1 Tax=Caerostris extrusa TaxID=172846 RepID=A0AAV4UJY2_CAEEX|nr:hypothetical protein CEXT_337891 [Caerostris extrusa]
MELTNFWEPHFQLGVPGRVNLGRVFGSAGREVLRRWTRARTPVDGQMPRMISRGTTNRSFPNFFSSFSCSNKLCHWSIQPSDSPLIRDLGPAPTKDVKPNIFVFVPDKGITNLFTKIILGRILQ